MKKLFSFCIVFIGLLWSVGCISAQKANTTTALVANKVDTILPNGYCIWYDTVYEMFSHSHSFPKSGKTNVISDIYKIEGYYKNGRRVGEWRISEDSIVFKKITYGENESVLQIEFFRSNGKLNKRIVPYGISGYHVIQCDSNGIDKFDRKIDCPYGVVNTLFTSYDFDF